MPNKILVISPDIAKESAKFLAKELKAVWKNPYNIDILYDKYNIIFKYGYCSPINVDKETTKVFNKSIPSKIAIDKIKTFNRLKEFDFCPMFTKKKAVATTWLNEGETIVGRTITTGNNGNGLFYITNPNFREEYLFYTKYINHTHELRVNCWKNKVISIYNKTRYEYGALREGRFKFTLWKGQENHPQLIGMIEKIRSKINLDFYGLDVVLDENGKLWMLEINTAPILFPYTCKKLVQSIKKEIQ